MKPFIYYIVFSLCCITALPANEVRIYGGSGCISSFTGLKSFALKASPKDGVELTVKGEKTQKTTSSNAKAVVSDVIKELLAMELTKKEIRAKYTLPITTIPRIRIEVSRGEKTIEYGYYLGGSLEEYIADYYEYLDSYLKRDKDNFLEATEADIRSLYKKHERIKNLLQILKKQIEISSAPAP